MIKFNAKLVAAVALARSRDFSRGYLCGVFFEGKKAIAADGIFLTVAHDDDSEIDKPGIYPVSKKAVTACAGKHADSVVFSNEQLHVRDESGTTLYIEPCTVIAGTFPDWRRIVPSDAGSATHASFRENIMRVICDTAKAIKSPTVRLTGEDENTPHIVTYSDARLLSVAMPYRHTGVVRLPAWLQASAQSETA